MKAVTLAAAAYLASGFCQAGFADDIIASEQIADGRLSFVLKPAFANVTLTVTGPNDFHASTFAKAGEVTINLARFGRLDDGPYRYQVTASGPDMITVRTPLDNGRDRLEAKRAVGISISGTFRIKGGEIIRHDTKKAQKQDP